MDVASSERTAAPLLRRGLADRPVVQGGTQTVLEFLLNMRDDLIAPDEVRLNKTL